MIKVNIDEDESRFNLHVEYRPTKGDETLITFDVEGYHEDLRNMMRIIQSGVRDDGSYHLTVSGKGTFASIGRDHCRRMVENLDKIIDLIY